MLVPYFLTFCMSANMGGIWGLRQIWKVLVAADAKMLSPSTFEDLQLATSGHRQNRHYRQQTKQTIQAVQTVQTNLKTDKWEKKDNLDTNYNSDSNLQSLQFLQCLWWFFTRLVLPAFGWTRESFRWVWKSLSNWKISLRMRIA